MKYIIIETLENMNLVMHVKNDIICLMSNITSFM